jgi:glycine betaine/proline transport system substrate-binding protein
MRLLIIITAFFAGIAPAFAADPPSCRAVRFADIGWTDITSTTAVASRILQGLGYQTNTHWMPTQQNDRAPYDASHSIDVLGPNLEGARYTLAVPQATYDAGLHDFADIVKFRDQLGAKIYGIEPGNDGNRVVLGLIKQGKFGLGDFDLVESSEQGMLAQLERAIRRHQMMVFLGWEPHPMNIKFAIQYLTDATNSFGPNDGAASVYTNVRAGYLDQCPNIARFLHQLKFTLKIEDTLMNAVLTGGQDANEAAEAWLKSNPETWQAWLAGVTTFDGQPAAPALKTSLGQ